PEEVAVEGLRLAARGLAVALLLRLRDHGAQRALRAARLGRPVEAVVLAGRAEEALRVLARGLVVQLHGRVLALRVASRPAALDRGQLIAPDAQREYA